MIPANPALPQRILRRYLFLILFTFFMGTTGFGQVSGGLIAGITSSQIDGDQWGGYSFWGYQLGGYADYKFSDRLALQIEITQSRRGSREAGIGRISLNYIDVPVLLRVTPQVSRGELNVETGLSANLMLSARSGFRGFTQDNTDLFARLSSEFHVGTSYFFDRNLGLFLRWSIGLTNLQAESQIRPWLTIHYFSAGIRLRLGRD